MHSQPQALRYSDVRSCVGAAHAQVCGDAGRAGRKGTQWEEGLVTTREPLDMAHLEHAMNMHIDDKACTSAGLLPTFEQVCGVARPGLTCSTMW